MKKVLVGLAISTLVPLSAHAVECTAASLNANVSKGQVASGETYRVSWNDVGAYEYRITESIPNQPLKMIPAAGKTRGTYFDLRHVASSHTQVMTAVTAYDGNGLPLCTDATWHQVLGDSALANQQRRVIIPVAGSAPGAHGAQFRTYLRLRTIETPTRGRIIFHPQGQRPSANDPSIRYELSEANDYQTEYDDVVGAMNASGIGWLELVPDADLRQVIPVAAVRLYNQTDEGTYGTMSDWYLPADVPSSYTSLSIDIPNDPTFRVNFGYVATGIADVSVRVMRGEQIHETGLVHLYDGDMRLGTIQQVFGLRKPLAPGDRVVMTAHFGSVIPFYTITDNGTNDPSLFVGVERSRAYEIESYFQ